MDPYPVEVPTMHPELRKIRKLCRSRSRPAVTQTLWLPNSYFKSRALQRLSVKVFFFLQVWVVLTDAEETSGTGTDTRSSWLPKRCRFGASPSVIAKFSTHDRPPTKSVTALPILCVHVRGKCLCVFACGWRAIRCVPH